MKSTYYAVICPDGHIKLFSFSKCQGITIDRFLHNTNPLYNRTHWRKLRKEGYQVKRFNVSISEIK